MIEFYNRMDRNSKTISLKEVCRTCLLPSDRLLSILSSIEIPTSEITKLPILDLLKIFNEILVSPNDGLPDNICSDCLDILQNWYAFKLKCETVSKQLQDDKKHITMSNARIKIESIEDYETLNEEQLEQDIFNRDDTVQDVSYVQKVKQEPEIDINTEKDDFNEIETDKQHIKNNLKCWVCMKVFKNKYNLKIHIRIHTGEQPYKCEICSKSFRYKDHLREHISIDHPAEVPAKNYLNCEICSKIFLKKSRFIKHMEIHTTDRPFQCENCSSTFAHSNTLTRHKQIYHPNEWTGVNSFKCPICSKVFTRNSDFIMHSRRHSDERPFKCDFCTKKFRYKCNMKNHMKTAHDDGTTDNRKFKCATCSTFFGRRSDLNRHMIIHSGEKSFQCEVCLKKYRFKHSLKNHKQVAHVDEKTARKFKCTTCSRSFGFKYELKQHMGIHTGERPYQCEVCNKKIRLKSNWKAHMQRIHGIKMQSLDTSKVTVAVPQKE